MSIQSEINRIKTDKESLITNLKEKGVQIADGATLGDISLNVKEIEIGIDTSDATATANDILGGKTAYVNGTKVTGNIAFQAAKTITPTTVNQTAVAGGYYTGGDIVVKGDSNLKAENIAEGISIFGVTGIHSGGNTDIEDSIVTRIITTYTNDRITTIGKYAFTYCSRLTSVSFPKCTSISNSAFTDCYNLTNVNFPKCTTIGEYAFYLCSSLTNISFPNCTRIDSAAFDNCPSLTSVSFPKCTSIGSSAFARCSRLTTIFLGASKVCTLAGSWVFRSAGIWSDKGYIYVPSSLYSSYKTATNWVFFSRRIFSYAF